MAKEKMNDNNTDDVAKESITATASGKDEQPSNTNLDPQDKETKKETTQMNEIPPDQTTTQVNTDKETSKGQANRDTQEQEGSKEQSTSRIQEYTISTSNPDTMEEDSLQVMYYNCTRYTIDG